MSQHPVKEVIDLALGRDWDLQSLRRARCVGVSSLVDGLFRLAWHRRIVSAMTTQTTDWRLTFNLADKRLRDLDKAIQRFSKRPVYRPVVKRNIKTGEQGIPAKFRHDVPESFSPEDPGDS